jgi:hypothetical protein
VHAKAEALGLRHETVGDGPSKCVRVTKQDTVKRYLKVAQASLSSESESEGEDEEAPRAATTKRVNQIQGKPKVVDISSESEVESGDSSEDDATSSSESEDEPSPPTTTTTTKKKVTPTHGKPTVDISSESEDESDDATSSESDDGSADAEMSRESEDDAESEDDGSSSESSMDEKPSVKVNHCKLVPSCQHHDFEFCCLGLSAFEGGKTDRGKNTTESG